MPGLLEGVKVLDLTHYIAGPYCTKLLSGLGVDVIKIERLGEGDGVRWLGPYSSGSEIPFGGNAPEDGAWFLYLNTAKQSVALDLKSAEGRQVVLELAAKADILVENFAPGGMDSLGLSYAVLQKANPALVVTSISNFGQTGPYASRPALDVIVQGMGGMLSITGEPGGGPVRPGASIGDITAALFATIAIQSALLERERSGEGQYIDISMLDCQISIMENAFMRYFTLGQIPERIGTRHPSSTPFQAFKTADGHVVVAIMGGSTDQWPLFCAAIEHAELIDDERFVTGWGRTQHYDELIPIISEAIAQKSTAEWVDILSGMGIPVGPVQDIAEVAADPQIAHRDMFVKLDHPAVGQVPFTGNPIKLSRTPSGPSLVPPGLGEHTAGVLRDVLGMGEARVAELLAEEVVA